MCTRKCNAMHGNVNLNLSYEETYKYSNLSTLYYLDRQSKIHAKSYQ